MGRGRCAEQSRAVGLKDATGDVTRPLRLRPRVGPQFRLLSGDDATALAFFTQGGDGCISVTSNVAPALCRNMHLAFRQGQIATAQRAAVSLAHLTAALFRESNPVPVKYALSLLNLMSPKVRLPLVELSERSKAELDAVMMQLCGEHAQDMIGGLRGPVQASLRVAVG